MFTPLYALIVVIVVDDVAGQAGVGFKVFYFSVPKLPAGGGRLVGLNSHTCL